MNSSDRVRAQYETDRNLTVRIRFQQMYSVNKQGFAAFIESHYDLEEGMRILELGCGNGSSWPELKKRLPDGCSVILSDFSAGMLDAAKARVGDHPQIAYQVIDAMDIPHEDNSMDVVIANMMLYHVPDLWRVLSEISRVLRPDGIFYCATYGENGIMSWLNGILSGYMPPIAMNTAFTLQNGLAALEGCFERVERADYPDSFRITDSGDLADYVLSLTSMADFNALSREELIGLFNSQMTDGAIYIPKEYGLFICRKKRSG